MNLETVIAARDRKTVYRNGDRCIKLFHEGYSKADILNEALNQARIEGTGLNIPGILEVTTVDGKWAIVYEYIEGKPLSELMAEQPEKKEEYIAFLVDVQLKLREETCPLLNRLRDKLGRKLTETDFDATTRYALYSHLESLPRQNHICHGDFSPSNIIITEDGTPYIIDWSHATQGNASGDVARSYILFRLRGDDEGARYYLNTFCEKTGTDKQRILEWIPVVAAALCTERDEADRPLLEGLVNGTVAL